MSLYITLLVKAENRDAFDGVTIGSKVGNGAEIVGFSIGDLMEFHEKVTDAKTMLDVEEAIEALEADVTRQLKEAK
jgi:hypothetical protein